MVEAGGGGAGLTGRHGAPFRRVVACVGRVAHRPWSPTSVAVDPAGEVWVADGHGASLVHRYAADGTYRASLTGNEGAGGFDCPHAVFVDRRGDEPELLVADRGNHRIQAFGLDGGFRRAFGDDVLLAPTEIAVAGDLLAVTDVVRARVTLFGRDDRVVAHLAEGAGAPSRPGWPNAEDRDGRPVAPPLERGRLNSPHGIAADASGNLYIGEWLVGARYMKLAAI
jgi:hypothetical protein